MIISGLVLLRMNKCQTKVVQKLETLILCSITLFFFENCTVYEIMWEDIVEQGRPQMTIWRIACLIPKATNAYLEYVIPVNFPMQHWLQERASMLRYTHIAVTVKG